MEHSHPPIEPPTETSITMPNGSAPGSLVSIILQCSSCGFLYELGVLTSCPRCGNTDEGELRVTKASKATSTELGPLPSLADQSKNCSYVSDAGSGDEGPVRAVIVTPCNDHSADRMPLQDEGPRASAGDADTDTPSDPVTRGDIMCCQCRFWAGPAIRICPFCGHVKCRRCFVWP